MGRVKALLTMPSGPDGRHDDYHWTHPAGPNQLVRHGRHMHAVHEATRLARIAVEQEHYRELGTGRGRVVILRRQPDECLPA
jgi:hypothetical protein